MPTFRYTCEDANHQLQHAEMHAADLESARRSLAAQGITPYEIVEVTDSGLPAKLSSRDANEVAVVLAEVADSQLPVVEGLRAAALECANRSVARTLSVIADDLERGLTLESVIDQRGQLFPSHVRALLAAATHTTQFGVALDELLEFHRENRATWSQISASLAYPIVVSIVGLAILAVMPFTLIPQLQQLFTEFELALPATTQAVFSLSDAARWLVLGNGQWVLLSAVAGVVAVGVFARVAFGSRVVPLLLASAPLIGDMWQWNGVAAFMRLLATMLDLGVPLPRALEFVGEGLADPIGRDTAFFLAHGAGQGRSLSEMIWQSQRLPMSVAPFMHWGEKTGRLPEALRAMNEMFRTRVRMRAMAVRLIGPTVVFVVVGFVMAVCVIALFSPMVQLIDNLS